MKSLKNRIRIELIGTDKVIDDTLDVSVKISKTNETKPNECTITIYNLSDETNSLIKDKCTGVRVYLSQGEIIGNNERSDWQLMFEGNLRSLKKYKKPPRPTKSGKPRKTTAKTQYNEPSVRTEFGESDIQTIIEIEDGRHISYLNAYFKKSYKGAVTNRQILSDVIVFLKQNSIPVGKIDTITEYTYPNGLAFSTQSTNVLNKICAPVGASFIVKNGVVCITNSGNSPETYAIALDGYNCARPEEQDNKEVKIESVLLPTVNPNDWVKLNFKTIAGAYKVYKIESEFDNFGETLKSELIVKAS